MTTLDRRRHRPGRGDQGDHGDARAPGTRAGCCRPLDALAGEHRAARARATRSAARRCGSNCAAGAAGFKLHEDWGTTPAAIDACLRGGRGAGVQVAIHTDTLNEAGYVEDTLAAIGGRPIHAYHTEGAGGGHAPGHHHGCRRAQRAAQSRPIPTRPSHGQHPRRAPRHADGLPPPRTPSIPEDLAFAESRIRPSTIAAEDVLHDLGAISMIGSRLPGHGPDRRGGDADLADRARDEASAAARCRATGGADDNMRARRYVAKYTICPAMAHGLDARGRFGRGRASWPTWCCGSRPSSASGRTRCSRAA